MFNKQVKQERFSLDFQVQMKIEKQEDVTNC